MTLAQENLMDAAKRLKDAYREQAQVLIAVEKAEAEFDLYLRGMIHEKS